MFNFTAPPLDSFKYFLFFCTVQTIYDDEKGKTYPHDCSSEHHL